MGNLCSSGTDRSEKKEDKQLPKSKDGEDEALLSKAGEGIEQAAAAGVGGDAQASGKQEDGQGLTGLLGGVVSAGGEAVDDVVENVQDQGQKAFTETKAEVADKGKEVVAAGKDAVVAGITQTVAEVRESAEQKAATAAEDASANVTSGQNSLTGFIGGITTQAGDAVANVESDATQVKGDVSDAWQSGQELTTTTAAGLESNAEAVMEESISAFESSKTEASNVVSQAAGEAAAVKTDLKEEGTESSGFMDNIKQTVQDKAVEVKEVAVEKGQEAKQTAEDYLSQAVESAKASAMGSFASATQSVTSKADDARESTSEAVTDVSESATNIEANVATEVAAAQTEVNQMQSSVGVSLESAADDVTSKVDDVIPKEKDVDGLATGATDAFDALARNMAETENKVPENMTVGSLTDVLPPLPPPPPPPPALDTELQKDEPADSGSGGLLGNFGAAASGAVQTGVGFVGEKIVDKAQDLFGGQEKPKVDESPIEAAQQSSQEMAPPPPPPPPADTGSGLMGGFGSAASGAVETGVGVVSEKIVDKVQNLFGVEKGDAEPAQPAPEQPVSAESSSAGMLETDFAAMGAQVVDKANAFLGSETKVEAAEEPVMKSEAHPDVECMPPESLESTDESDFLEKAKSLLEQHRNSIDGSKMAAQVAGMANDAFSDNNNETQPGDVADSSNVNNNNSKVEASIPEEVTDKAREETARDFVEGIIDKATNIVSESMSSNQEEGDSGDASPSTPDPCVDHAEETMEPRKRGVCFVSPQTSDQSFSSLSSPPEISPPPPPQVPAAHDVAAADLSPPSDASSISQGELVERDIELDLPSPPQSTTEEESVPTTTSPDDDDDDNDNDNDAPPCLPDDHQGGGGLLDNRPVPGMDEADESLQRIAMEVTTKAVHDAIKIVTENGTGRVSADNDLDGVVVSSPSSGGAGANDDQEDEEEMTTTDSSQVERGSSVSDLTDDTSQQGSIADSLSSYDPGAAFRQDVTDLADLPATSPTGDKANTTTTTMTTTETETAAVSDAAATTTDSQLSNTGDASHLDTEPSSQAETPTPTNQNSFADAYSQNDQQQQQQQPQPSSESERAEADGSSISNNNNNNNRNSNSMLPPPAPPSPSSQVPSTFPAPLNDALTKQPTIVINSPDSAPNTNGSLEDVNAASSQSEALI